MLNQLWNYQLYTSEPFVLTISQIIKAIIVFGAGFFLSGYISRIVEAKVAKYKTNEFDHRSILFKKLSYWTFLSIFLYISLSILDIPLSIIKFLIGGLGIGLGFGLKDYINNIFSGIIIMVERPFKIGDVVNIKENIGRIADINFRSIRIYTEDKLDIIIPNSVALNECIINWTRTENVIYTELPISVDYESDIERATQVMKEACLNAEGVLHDPPPIILFKTHGPFSLNFSVMCAIEVQNKLERWEKESSINYSINKYLRNNNIKIAYPRSDIYFDSSKPLTINMNKPD